MQILRKSEGQLTISLFVCILLWLIFCWQGITTAVEIWWGNDIFNHCFFVIPGALYFIYLKRHALLSKPISPTLLPLLIIVPSILVYVIGIAGDVNLLTHMATFVLLPAVIWANIGHKAAYSIFFPLVFMLFSIPVGEQLTPLLQQITADGAVKVLDFTGVPYFRNGLYIEIPQGRFLVAEACSGVSFFIASIVIGSVYTYLNITSTSKRVCFVLISFALPIAANMIRVFGIVFIAYKTDMKYAAGADHLIYGWFFFAFVIICLIGLGELFRDVSLKNESDERPSDIILVNKGLYTIVTIPLLFIVSFVWLQIVNASSATEFADSQLRIKSIDARLLCNSNINWEPVLDNPDIYEQVGINVGGNCNGIIAQAWFSGNNNELVSGLNRLFDPEKWALLDTIQITQTINSQVIYSKVYQITSPTEQKLYLQSVFLIDGIVFGDGIRAKIYQTTQKLKGKSNDGAFIIAASEDKASLSEAMVEVLESQ